MPLENVLQRLSQHCTFRGQDTLRGKVMRRIHPPLLQNLRAATFPRNQARIRQEVLARIAHPALSGRFREVQQLLTPSLDLLACIKEEILCRVGIVRVAPRWHMGLRFAAVTALLALVLRITPIFFIAPPLQATAENLLIPTEGFVSITHGAEWSRVEKRTDLTEPLTVRTGPDSAATIILGDAVLRLGENAELNLRAAAFSSPARAVEPLARIIYGQLWATSLLSEAFDPKTAIVLPQGTLAFRQGSVDMIVDPQQSTVRVFHRFAEVTPSGSGPIHLIEGDQLTLLADSSVQRHLITGKMREDPWVQTNTARDDAHRMEVEGRKQKLAAAAAGTLPTSAFYYSLKRAAEQMDLFWTFGTVAKQGKKLQFAQTRLNEAVALLSQGQQKAAESPLAEYREAIRQFATLTEKEARDLLTSSLVDSSSTVASALPHSPLYEVKKAIVEASTGLPAAEISMDEVDIFLLSDALFGIEGLVSQGDLERAAHAFNGIEGAVASVLARQELEEMKVEKGSLKAVKTILRSIAFSLKDAEETVNPQQSALLKDLELRIAGKLPPEAPISVASKQETQSCMNLREVTRRTNQFLAAVYTYQTPVGRRNAVLQQIALLPNCPASGRILTTVMNKVPIPMRSFVWEALQKIGAGT